MAEMQAMGRSAARDDCARRFFDAVSRAKKIVVRTVFKGNERSKIGLLLPCVGYDVLS
jgi:hypothetical protein